VIKVPRRSWTRLATILGLPGSESFSGIQEEVVPVQDLTRVLQADRVKQTSYSLDVSPAANFASDLQWNDLSDWTAVQVNGVVASADADLPQDGDERIVIALSLQVSGTIGEYTSAEVKRFVPTGTGPLGLLMTFGAVVATHSNASPAAPLLLPQWLVPQEFSVRFTGIVTGANADFAFNVQMISAEKGVLSPYVGV